MKLHMGQVVKRVAAGAGLDVRKRRSVSNPDHRLVSLLIRRRIETVVDVGANTGQYGRRLRAFGYRGRIISFEPLSSAYVKLRAAAENDALWYTHHLAVGDCDQHVTLNVAGNSVSSSMLSMRPLHEEAAPGSSFQTSEVVVQRRLDSLWGELIGATKEPVFLKVDTQGYERQVLLGARNSLEQVTGVQLELSLIELYQGQMLYREALDLMGDLRYELFGLEPGFASADGRLLQCDAIFFRDEGDSVARP